jgi:hypothetical protein
MPLVKAFDFINTAADKSFLAHCRCQGGSCSCSDAATGQHLFSASNNKDSPMTTTNKTFADFIKGASTLERAKLADSIEAAAATLPAADLKVLIQALSAEVQAQEAKTGKEAQRKQRLAKAMSASATDMSAQNTLKNIREELRRIGLPNDLNAAAATGYQLGEVDKALKASGWSPERRMNLKNKLDHVGLLTY